MVPSWMKGALLAFVGLSSGVLGNMLLLQPVAERKTAASAEAARQGGAVPAPVATQPDKSTPARQPIATAALGNRPVPPAEAGLAVASGDGVDLIRTLQRELKSRGYETGNADGKAGLMTRASIMAYESDHGLAITGEPSEQLLHYILLGGEGDASQKARGIASGSQAVQIVRNVQKALIESGYKLGKPDGKLSEDTIRAIRDFETENSMPETGRISGQLVARLNRGASQRKVAAGATSR